MICISCPNEVQIIPSLTLSRLLKENYNVKTVIGGNIISRIDDEIKTNADSFDYFYDYIITGCGEESIVKLASYLLGEDVKLSDIKGLMYKENNKLIINEPDVTYNINNSAKLCMDGLQLDKYFTPEIIMPIQTSKGCYWGKCLFCGLHYPPKKYSVKDVDKVIDEIEFLNKEHGINVFEFIDEAVHPKYLSELADEILKRKLKIKYVCCARLEEKSYSDELCNKLYQSGLRLVQFGFESASKNIYDKLNKGIEFDNRLETVAKFAKSGIWTYLYAIYGYPFETIDDALKTLNVRSENKEIIDTLFLHRFWLDKKAPAYKQYESINISQIYENNSIFKQTVQFKAETGLSKEVLDEL